MKRMFRGIRWQIALPYTFLILLTMFGILIYFSRFFQQVQLENLESSLISQTRLISRNLTKIFSEQNDLSIIDSLADQWGELIDARVTIIAADGTVLGESQADHTMMENHLERPEVQQAIEEGQGISHRLSYTTNQEMLYASTGIFVDGELRGFSRLALPLARINAETSWLRQKIIIFTVIISIASVSLGLIIAEYTSRPVRNLNEAVAIMDGQRLERNLIPAADDEIGELSNSIETMSGELYDKIETLQAEESKLSAVLAQMTDGVVMVNAVGEVVLINQKSAQLFDIDLDEAIGQSLIRVLHNHQFVELWEKCLKKGKEQSKIVEFYNPSLFIQGVATPLGDYLQGNILLIFQDLTNVRRLETVRRDFISNISHEIRTPLASLKALSETLLAGALNDPPAANRFINLIDVEVDALNQMASELLALAKIESQESIFNFKPVKPCKLAAKAVERLRLQAERADINLIIQCEAGLPKISADNSRLEQVFVNLVHNAIKFTPPGGEILVCVSKNNNAVQFSVKDTGEGISAEDLSRIFERFYKTDKARSSGGTGLGLAIASHLVEAHGGTIRAESDLGNGSTFIFEIPVIL